MFKKLKEIGSEFYFEKPTHEENGFFDRFRADVVHMMSGRTAIRFVLEDFSWQDDKKVAYLPAYTCPTTIEPFLKAGYQVTYYDVDSAFRPMFDKGLMKSVSVVYIEGYFGFANYDEPFLRECKRAGIKIIHDTTHTLFSDDGIFSNADYFIGSLRKWFGIPAGGIAACLSGGFLAKPASADPKYTDMRLKALSLKSDYIITGDLNTKTQVMQLFSDAEEHLCGNYHMQAADELSIRLAMQFPIQEMILRRRENYCYLLENLPSVHDVKPAFADLPEGTCPLFFPVFSKKRDSIKSALVANKIYPPIHWPISEAINVDEYPNAKRIYQTILSLPCDQRYKIDELKRVCEVLACLK